MTFYQRHNILLLVLFAVMGIGSLFAFLNKSVNWINYLPYLVLAAHLFLWNYLTLIAHKKGKDKPTEYIYIFLGVALAGNNFTFIWIPVNILLVIVIWGVLSQKRNLRTYFFSKENYIPSIIIGSCLGLGLGLLFYYSVDDALYMGSLANKPLNVLVISLVQTSISEEMLYRGMLLGCLRRYDFSDFKSNSIQSILFILIHIPRFILTHNLGGLLIVSIFSFFAGFITLKYKTLFGPCVMHIITNMFSIV
jgi:membrane protease YdiL (CAAX protease family)